MTRTIPTILAVFALLALLVAVPAVADEETDWAALEEQMAKANQQRDRDEFAAAAEMALNYCKTYRDSASSDRLNQAMQLAIQVSAQIGLHEMLLECTEVADGIVEGRMAEMLRPLRVQALAQAGRMDDANELLAELEEEGADARIIGQLRQVLGRIESQQRQQEEWREMIERPAEEREAATGFDEELIGGEEGETLSLEDFEGKVVLVDFWATWCGPCRSLMASNLAPLWEKYQDENFELVGIGTSWRGDTAERQHEFAEQQGYDWTKLYDADNSTATAYGVRGIPYLALIDEEGRLIIEGSGLAVIELVEEYLAERFGDDADDTDEAGDAEETER